MLYITGDIRSGKAYGEPYFLWGRAARPSYLAPENMYETRQNVLKVHENQEYIDIKAYQAIFNQLQISYIRR